MGLITEKQLRSVRVKLFRIMDDVIIIAEKNEPLNKHQVMELSLKVVGLSYEYDLAKQLWAEYKTWGQQQDSKVRQIGCVDSKKI